MDKMATAALDQELLVGQYRKMLMIRLLEEKIQQLLLEGEIPDLYPSAGQEAVPVGVCAALRPGDLTIGTYRGVGHVIAKGGTPRSILAELYGRTTGCSRGRGGSKHLAAFDQGMMGTYAIVGAGIPIAVGLALAAKIQGKDQVVACFFGDGASNQGVFHEGLNLASIWKAPVIFVCENNLYAATTPLGTSTSVGRISQRAGSYSITGLTIDGNDVAGVYRAAQDAVARARRGEPTLLECLTYRHGGHFAAESAIGWKYRTPEEMAAWRERDPLIRVEALLNKRPAWPSAKDKLEKSIREEIAEAVEFARKSPLPEPAEVLKDCFSDIGNNFLWRWPE